MQDETWLIHGGRDPRRQQGMVNPPVYHASTVLFETVAELEAAAANPLEGVYYGRYGTPVHFELERAVARLEDAHGAVTTCSGLAAISVALMSVAANGAHLLVADNVYAPTRKLCEGLLKRMGVATTYFDPDIGDGIADLIGPETVAVFVEAPGSLTFEIPDVPAIAATARNRGIPVLLDNTWATPLGYPAYAHGVDISIHAATKYIVGHADAMLGLVTANDAHYRRVRKTAVELGYCAGPDDVYLGLRGLRTLGLRLERHAANAMALCDWLAQRPEVARVLYPPRPGDAYHDLWRRDFTGASGLFGVVLKPCDEEALRAMLDGLELFGMGFSWGGYESLVLPADPAKYRTATTWQDAGPVLRFHAGLEALSDLEADLEAGFRRLSR